MIPFGPKMKLAAMVGVGVLFVAMAGAIYLLLQERDALNEQVGSLSQANTQLEQSLKDERQQNVELNQEIDRRDQVVLQAARNRKAARSQESDIRQQMGEGLQDDPWAGQPVPDIVVDSLRRNAASTDED